MNEQLIKLGFVKNTKVIHGFKPHYRKGNDFLFLIGADFYISKIYSIDYAFRIHTGKIYGVLTGKEPGCASGDWLTADKLTLLKLDPLSKGQWSVDGNEIEFVQTAV